MCAAFSLPVILVLIGFDLHPAANEDVDLVHYNLKKLDKQVGGQQARTLPITGWACVSGSPSLWQLAAGSTGPCNFS